MKINWLKYRLIYFLLSAFLIAIGTFSLLVWGLPLGVDFKGGSIIEYKIENEISTEEALSKLDEKEIEVNSIQKTGEGTYLFRLSEIDKKTSEQISLVLKEFSASEVEEIKFENIGPSIGPELIKKTVYAILLAAGSILLWVAYQFKSVKFGTSAILAMFHDSFILVGSFSLLGHFSTASIDFLFVTALLTTLSFSVHDTIVVFDRIREIRKKHGGSISEIANKALSETMRRSINNSLTIGFVLVALAILGGSTVRWFAIALLIGTVLGTYSSPFVAVPLLVTWEEVEKKLRK